MILAILIAALMYIMINTITAVGYQPWQTLLNNKEAAWATGYVVKNVLGTAGLVLLGIAMFCAVISGMNAFYISTSRLMYAMSIDGSLPKVFGRLGVKHGTPRNAILFVMIMSLSTPWFGREVLSWIVDMTSVGAAVVFAYTTAAAAILAYKHKHRLQMWLGVVGCAFSLFFLSLLVIPGMPGYLTVQSQICLAIWIVLGVIFYLVRRNGYLREQRNK